MRSFYSVTLRKMAVTGFPFVLDKQKQSCLLKKNNLEDRQHLKMPREKILLLQWLHGFASPVFARCICGRRRRRRQLHVALPAPYLAPVSLITESPVSDWLLTHLSRGDELTFVTFKSVSFISAEKILLVEFRARKSLSSLRLLASHRFVSPPGLTSGTDLKHQLSGNWFWSNSIHLLPVWVFVIGKAWLWFGFSWSICGSEVWTKKMLYLKQPTRSWATELKVVFGFSRFLSQAVA
jgi:hypothetical protein